METAVPDRFQTLLALIQENLLWALSFFVKPTGWEPLNLVLKKIKPNCFCTYTVFTDSKVYAGHEK
jgi:hypothetical protein